MRPEIVPLEGELDVGDQKPELISRVVANSIELDGVDRALLEKDAHGVGYLDLAARAGLGLLDGIEDVGREDITTNDSKV